ncbi:hypothetical protein LKMONMHP_2360 [Methylobacterium organophilum]|uniref:RNA polymerase, sigma-24 subunit, ECF subfamily n=1 Tax=Methylobacterium organophilum TaxID=410 RepID=A0ABQ4TAX9_METOR|nr:hypothetical protein LKMONMHP_2360 [Methylobacterium organophilum]
MPRPMPTISHDAAGRAGSGRTDDGAAPGPWGLAALAARKPVYLALARRLTGCPALAEDVVQDVFLRLVAEPPHRGRGAIPGKPEAYVAGMVRNLAIDRARRLRFEARVFTDLDGAGEAAGGLTPEAVASDRQRLRLAEAALDGLPEPVRTVFCLHRLHGVPQKDIAARLGVSRALVCGLVRRGHLGCLAALEGGCPLAGSAQEAEEEQGPEPVSEEFRRQPAAQHTVEAVELR